MRGGPYEPLGYFVVSGDGTVTDSNTGLMWQPCNLGKIWDGTPCTGSSVNARVDGDREIEKLNNINSLGYSDWRMPNVNELLSLMDYSRSSPATTFPNTSSETYWTTTGLLFPYAWFLINFKTGGVANPIPHTTYVYPGRAVRGGSCRANGDWCIDGNDCAEGEACVEGVCQPVVDNDPPSLTSGPFVAAGTWPMLSRSQASPRT